MRAVAAETCGVWTAETGDEGTRLGVCGLDWASDRVKRTVKICLGQNIG